jgi:hypothetical protein
MLVAVIAAIENGPANEKAADSGIIGSMPVIGLARRPPQDGGCVRIRYHCSDTGERLKAAGAADAGGNE